MVIFVLNPLSNFCISLRWNNCCLGLCANINYDYEFAELKLAAINIYGFVGLVSLFWHHGDYGVLRFKNEKYRLFRYCTLCLSSEHSLKSCKHLPQMIPEYGGDRFIAGSIFWEPEASHFASSVYRDAPSKYTMNQKRIHSGVKDECQSSAEKLDAVYIDTDAHDFNLNKNTSLIDNKTSESAPIQTQVNQEVVYEQDHKNMERNRDDGMDARQSADNRLIANVLDSDANFAFTGFVLQEPDVIEDITENENVTSDRTNVYTAAAGQDAGKDLAKRNKDTVGRDNVDDVILVSLHMN